MTEKRFKPIERLSNGELPANTWPGAYPLMYVMEDGEVICAECANGHKGSEAKEGHDDPQWNIVGQMVHWEGGPAECAHCLTDVESAYGEEPRVMKTIYVDERDGQRMDELLRGVQYVLPSLDFDVDWDEIEESK